MSEDKNAIKMTDSETTNNNNTTASTNVDNKDTTNTSVNTDTVNNTSEDINFDPTSADQEEKMDSLLRSSMNDNAEENMKNLFRNLMGDFYSKYDEISEDLKKAQEESNNVLHQKEILESAIKSAEESIREDESKIRELTNALNKDKALLQRKKTELAQLETAHTETAKRLALIQKRFDMLNNSEKVCVFRADSWYFYAVYTNAPFDFFENTVKEMSKADPKSTIGYMSDVLIKRGYTYRGSYLDYLGNYGHTSTLSSINKVKAMINELTGGFYYNKCGRNNVSHWETTDHGAFTNTLCLFI